MCWLSLSLLVGIGFFTYWQVHSQSAASALAYLRAMVALLSLPTAGNSFRNHTHQRTIEHEHGSCGIGHGPAVEAVFSLPNITRVTAVIAAILMPSGNRMTKSIQ